MKVERYSYGEGKYKNSYVIRYDNNRVAAALTRDELVQLAASIAVYIGLPWQPIDQLSESDRYGDEEGFLLMAPELVDADCNVHGVGMGYFQDGRDVPCDPKRGAIWDEPETDEHLRDRLARRLSCEEGWEVNHQYDAVSGEELDTLAEKYGFKRGQYDGWLACKWSMQNDEWREVPCTPTHFLRLRGVK